MSNKPTTNDMNDVLPASEWIQPSIDSSHVLGSNNKIIDGLYSATVEETVVIDTVSSQDWFWSEKWQAGERAAQADIEAGRIHSFSNVEDAIAALGLEEDAGD